MGSHLSAAKTLCTPLCPTSIDLRVVKHRGMRIDPRESIAFIAPQPLHCVAQRTSRQRLSGTRSESVGRQRQHPRAAMQLAEAGGRFAVSAAGNGVLYVGAKLVGQRVLTADGLLHALMLGVLLGTTVGLRGWGLCVLLFGVGSGLTRVGRARKEKLGIAEERGGARKPAQVWGAAGAAAICALATWATALVGWMGASQALRVAYACAVSAKMADTAASEVGKAYGTRTYLVTTLRQVPAGTEGAVSGIGTIAGVLLGCVGGLYAFATGMVSARSGVIIALAATVAFVAESFLGALYQKRWKLSNELVNFVQTAVAAFVGLLLVSITN